MKCRTPRHGVLTRPVQTQIGLFTRGLPVKVIAIDDATAVIDLGIGLRDSQHFHAVVTRSAIQLGEAAA